LTSCRHALPRTGCLLLKANLSVCDRTLPHAQSRVKSNTLKLFSPCQSSSQRGRVRDRRRHLQGAVQGERAVQRFRRPSSRGQYHEFRSAVQGLDYGSEFDFYGYMPLRSGFYAQFKYANYQADQFFTDVQKVIFGLGYQY
jgi:hypothetical protein